MARLNAQLDSDDELPDLSTILRPQRDAAIGTPAKTPKQAQSKMPCQRTDTQKLTNEDLLIERQVIPLTTVTKVSSGKPQSRKQRPLGHLKQSYVNSLLLPLVDPSISESKWETCQSTEKADNESNQASPKNVAKLGAEYSKLDQVSANPSKLSRDDYDSSTDLSGFMVPDSSSDVEVLVSTSPKKQSRTSKKIATANLQEPASRVSRRPQSNTQQPTGTVDFISSEDKNCSTICLESPPRIGPFTPKLVEAHRTLDDHLIFPTSKSKSPYKSEEDYHSLTPSSSPSKSRLKSPSKRHRIPPSPHRPSIDAFWSQDVINDWNQQYSPRKVVESPPKFQLHCVDDDEESSPSESSRKNPMKSPAKKHKDVIDSWKLFNDKKHELAIAFLAEVDQTITSGQVASMAYSTGGVQIIWSKKLSSTAGRANWRREAVRSKYADGFASNTTYRHYASIELAEKVINDEGRLINVIAHEYCHLANFMISGIKDNPHGKEFKTWARKCTNAFSHRAINVTTKHTYTIAYKYIWTCMLPTCGLEYKRHSKSIDPSKHSCGNCKGKLVQVQPAPRKGAGQGKRSEYQDFVKRENGRVRLEKPGAGFGEIMSILGREFKECKRNEAKRASTVDESGALEKFGSNDLDILDSVVRKLDFLNLES